MCGAGCSEPTITLSHVAGSSSLQWSWVKEDDLAFPKHTPKGRLEVEFGDASLDLQVGKDILLKVTQQDLQWLC